MPFSSSSQRPSYRSSLQDWERLNPLSLNVSKTSAYRQWNLFKQLREDLSNYFGFLHREIDTLHKEVKRVDSRLDSCAKHIDSQHASLSNEIQTSIRRESKYINEKIETLRGYSQSSFSEIISHIDEIPNVMDKISKVNNYNANGNNEIHASLPSTPPSTPPESPVPSIIPGYSDTIKPKRNKLRRIPIRCAVGTQPSLDNPDYIRGILVKGGVCTIARNYVPKGSKIVKFDTALKVTLPVYLLNAATLSRDRRKGNARTLKVWIEFQIIEHSNSAISIGQNAIKAHGLNLHIDSWKGIVEVNNVLNSFKPFRIPIIETCTQTPIQTPACHDRQSIPPIPVWHTRPRLPIKPQYPSHSSVENVQPIVRNQYRSHSIRESSHISYPRESYFNEQLEHHFNVRQTQLTTPQNRQINYQSFSPPIPT